MNKEAMIKRLAQLDGAMQQALVNYQMICGQRQECSVWLQELEKLENQPSECEVVTELVDQVEAK